MFVDLRQPTVVMAGAFNAHIFTPPWIANVLYGIPEGENVDGIMVADILQGTQRPYIREVAVLAEEGRLSIFVDRFDDAVIALGESLPSKIAETLPHTPITALGVNFQFVYEDFDEGILALLKHNDTPEKIGAVSKHNLVSEIKVDEKTTLNLKRGISDGQFVINFNFHTPLGNMKEIFELPKDLIRTYFESSKKILNDLYNLSLDEMNQMSALNQNQKREA